MLKPMLARGELRMVGATTLDEYRERIEKNPPWSAASSRSWSPSRPSRTPSRSCADFKGRYEAHHKVVIADSALVAAATLSDRYITCRFLPTRPSTSSTRPPPAAHGGNQLVPRRRDRRTPTRGGTGCAWRSWPSTRNRPRLRQRLEKLRRDLADKEEELRGLTAGWERRSGSLNRVGELKEKLDELRGQAERAQRDGDFDTASKLLYGEIPTLERDLEASEAEEEAARDTMVKEEVGPDDIADVVGSWTGIPAGRLLEGETQKPLLRMEEELGRRLIGQSEAVQAVSDAVRRTRAGIADPDRPTGSFLFLGPTGVGKTELAKALADFLFDGEGRDPHRHERVRREAQRGPCSRAPLPGTSATRRASPSSRRPCAGARTASSWDEVEKAHPEVFDILLQVLDDGRLTNDRAARSTSATPSSS